MEKISRYILVLVAIITSAVILPKLYWMAFEKPIRTPFIMYSCMNDDFMLQYGLDRKDTKGNSYTRDEYEEMLPLLSVRQLLVAGKMPDTIKGVAMDMHELSRERSMFRYKPEDMNTPLTKLYPLFESESGRANLEMPDDYFRISWRMEFVNAETNKIDEEKSRLFSSALFKKDFKFPASQIAGIPTTRKSCDEGYFVVDNAGQLFHVKMIVGQPYVKKVDLEEGMQVKFINCVDFRDKKYYAYIFTEKNELYILTQGEYKFVKWPVAGFDADNCQLKIYGDFFNYTAIVEANDHLVAYALDKDYNLLDEYTESWLPKEERTEGKVFASIFPIELSMSNEYNNFTNFYFKLSKGYIWIILNILLAGLHFVLLRRRGIKMNGHVLDFAIVLITGLFGFLAVNIFPNKFFK